MKTVKTETRAFFRVDANRLIGTGHLARCRCLAREGVRKGIHCSFIMTGGRSPITESLEREGFDVFAPSERAYDTADELAAFISRSDADRKLLIVDSPCPSFYSEAFQSGIRKNGIRLMVIAFRSEGHFTADAVHNQNLLALEERYSAEPFTRLLLGPRYVILDERFIKLREARGTDARRGAETLLLFFGGADASNLTLKVLRSLASLEQPLRRIITVVGPLNGRLGEIAAFARANTALPIDLHIDTPDMPELMAEADIAVTSGGLSIWELACIGVPDVVIATSERERIHSPLLEKRGTCLYLGHQNEVAERSIREAVVGLIEDAEKRSAMTRAGRDLVDGQGTARVIELVMDLLMEGSSVETKGCGR